MSVQVNAIFGCALWLQRLFTYRAKAREKWGTTSGR
jgi:hypothetical protein